MRKQGRIDTNQREIMQALRDIGASVEVLSGVGHGCPDLLVGYQGTNYLLECKSPKGKATSDQCYWMARWNGKLPDFVRTVDEAFKAIGAKVK